MSLRTVERACRGYRAEWAAQARAPVRFETAPGQQLQIDFGLATVEIDGARQKVHVFVATLGYSRLGYVAAFRHKRQAAWLAGLEGAIAHFGGIPREVLLDNAKALVLSHDIQTREVRFNERSLAFLCQPEIARKDERRIQMGTRIAHFPCVTTLAGFDYATQPSVD